MGFWIFMMLMNVMMPGLMIIFGRIFMKHPPKNINGFYGYRTKRSRASQETWDYAQTHFGRLWYRIGLVLVPIAILTMLPVLGKDVETIGCYGSALCIVLCAVLIAPIFWTEAQLKKKFK